MSRTLLGTPEFVIVGIEFQGMKRLFASQAPAALYLEGTSLSTGGLDALVVTYRQLDLIQDHNYARAVSALETEWWDQRGGRPNPS